MYNFIYYSLAVIHHLHYMFRPNEPSSGVKAVVVLHTDGMKAKCKVRSLERKRMLQCDIIYILFLGILYSSSNSNFNGVLDALNFRVFPATPLVH
jgi:hypothetical protein